MKNFPDAWRILIVLAVATAVCFLYFGRLMWTPNEVAPTFGGDGLTIHYNLQYHAAYGHGTTLTSQYHPTEEVIFLTDAQAVVGVVLAWLRPWFPGLAGYSVGISNVLIFWSSVFAILLLYLIYRRLGVGFLLSLILAVLAGLMSPQILRQMGGQYTLGYPFLLPLIIWYQLVGNTSRHYWRWTVFVTLTIIVFGLNNPYVYGIAMAYLLASAVFGLIWNKLGGSAFRARTSRQSTGLASASLVQWLLVFAVSTVAIYATIRGLDTATDRIPVPYGFFKNTATWSGLLTTPEAVTSELLYAIFPGLTEPRREQELYLGLVPLLLTVGLVFIGVLRRGKTMRLSLRLTVPLLGGLAGLVFAFALPFSFFPDWTYDHLATVVQFRAPVRFAWPLYYVLAICGGYALHLVGRHLSGWRAVVAVGVPLLIWAVEVHQFLRFHLEGHTHHNAFVQWRMDPMRMVLREAGVDTTTYSSIYLLPSEQGWSDKLHHPGEWRSNYEGYRAALVTGIPLLNGKYSRVSLSTSLQSLQLISDPLIRPTLLDDLDPDKYILLLASLEDELLPGEASLLEAGEFLFDNGEFTLRRITPAALLARHTAARSQALKTFPIDGIGTLTETMEDDPTYAFTGTGSRHVDGGWQTIIELPAREAWLGDSLEVSTWVRVDGSRFGGPNLYFDALDAQGQKIVTLRNWTNAATDTDRGWLRVSWRLRLPQQTTQVKLIGEHVFGYHLDNLLIRPADTDMLTVSGSDTLANNYPTD